MRLHRAPLDQRALEQRERQVLDHLVPVGTVDLGHVAPELVEGGVGVGGEQHFRVRPLELGDVGQGHSSLGHRVSWAVGRTLARTASDRRWDVACTGSPSSLMAATTHMARSDRASGPSDAAT